MFICFWIIAEDLTGTAAKWQAAIYLSSDNRTGQINVTVGNFPYEFNFTTLTYYLYDVAADSTIRDQDVDGVSLFYNIQITLWTDKKWS